MGAGRKQLQFMSAVLWVKGSKAINPQDLPSDFTWPCGRAAEGTGSGGPGRRTGGGSRIGWAGRGTKKLPRKAGP